jgi:hypothetical protein
MDLLKRTFNKMQAIDTSKMPPAESSQASTSAKAKDLLAFHTITTMLSFIQSPASRRLSFVTGPICIERNDRRELRVLDALSAVLIREHEITAAVAPPHYNGSHLQVFASVVHPSESLLQHGANSDDQSLWDRFCNLTATLNPRTSKIYGNTDSLLNNTSLPLIGDYEDKVPRNLITAAKGNVPVLDVFLQSHW